MTKKQRINRLEKLVLEMAKMVGLSISFYDFDYRKDKKGFGVYYDGCKRPAIWTDEKFTALFKYLGIAYIDDGYRYHETKVVGRKKEKLGK